MRPPATLARTARSYTAQSRIWPPAASGAAACQTAASAAPCMASATGAPGRLVITTCTPASPHTSRKCCWAPNQNVPVPELAGAQARRAAEREHAQQAVGSGGRAIAAPCGDAQRAAAGGQGQRPVATRRPALERPIDERRWRARSGCAGVQGALHTARAQREAGTHGVRDVRTHTIQPRHHLWPQRGLAKVTKVAEQRHALVARGIVEGHLDHAVALLHPAADAAQQAECQPAPLVVACASRAKSSSVGGRKQPGQVRLKAGARAPAGVAPGWIAHCGSGHGGGPGCPAAQGLRATRMAGFAASSAVTSRSRSSPSLDASRRPDSRPSARPLALSLAASGRHRWARQATGAARAPSEPSTLCPGAPPVARAPSGSTPSHTTTPPLSVMHASALAAACQAMPDTVCGTVRPAASLRCCTSQRSRRQSCPAVTRCEPAACVT